ncbi:glycosyltransferase family 9 protein [bacterium]|nr:glycosyltransferase family 9 protein [bacterium]
MVQVNRDCKFYRGDIPCTFHKSEGVHCSECPYYTKISKKILIIKLGAIGDVIRTTPLIRRFEKEFPDAQIHWLTNFPDVVPSSVDYIYSFNPESIEILKNMKFDLLLNLDKDREACALANRIDADDKKGFVLKDGFCFPVDQPAHDKWLTGLFDDLNKLNTKSYPEEIFAMCGLEYNKEEYIVEVEDKIEWNIPGTGKIIGLNTGCGDRWETRLWPVERWVELSKLLADKGYRVLLLGGGQEDEKNRYIAKETGAIYLGHFPINRFFTLVNQCSLVVTAVSMAFHVALGLGKRIVLFNNIFNPNEFELFGRGIIVQPDVPCRGCFKGSCDKDCMILIKAGQVLNAVQKLIEPK